MARYSLGSRTSATASGAACWEYRTTTTDRVRIMELGVTLATAVASIFGLGRPAAIGVTPTSPVTSLAEEPGDAAGTGNVALAWATGPTIPTNFLRRLAVPGTIGAGIVWQWVNGLVIPVSSSLILWNLQLNGLADVYVVTDE